MHIHVAELAFSSLLEKANSAFSQSRWVLTLTGMFRTVCMCIYVHVYKLLRIRICVYTVHAQIHLNTRTYLLHIIYANKVIISYGDMHISIWYMCVYIYTSAYAHKCKYAYHVLCIGLCAYSIYAYMWIMSGVKTNVLFASRRGAK